MTTDERFTLRWVIAPAPVTLKSRTGEAEVHAANVMDACHKLKKQLAKEHHVPIERIEVTRAVLHV